VTMRGPMRQGGAEELSLEDYRAMIDTNLPVPTLWRRLSYRNAVARERNIVNIVSTQAASQPKAGQLM